MVKDFECITSLRRQLLDLGYRSYQIDDIYRETVGTCNIDGLPPEQSQILIKAMEEYIEFAHKCRRRKS